VNVGEECDDPNRIDGDGCDADCPWTCHNGDECQNGTVCDGTETCNLETHLCVNGAALTCTPLNACNTASCDPVTGCVNTLIDRDGDGHASTQLGGCGNDCDDNDATIYYGAPELCDGKDNDCDSSIDESAPYWYMDCDIDGYSASTAHQTQQCQKPAAPGAGLCGNGITGDWTNRMPADQATTDCQDKNNTVFPGQTTCYSTPYAPGNSYDYNCNGVEEQCTTTVFRACLDLLGRCIGGGWQTAAPACGASANYVTCRTILGGCSTAIAARTQTCR